MDFYGFKMSIGDEQAKIIQFIYAKYAYESWGWKRISDHLNEQNVPSPRNKNWTHKMVQMILSRKSYRDRIVSSELDDKVKMLLEGRSSGKMAQSSYDYPFSVILKCGRCGVGYKGVMDGNKYRSYKCQKSCGNKSISELKLEKLFLDELAAQDIKLDKKWTELNLTEKKELIQYSFEKIVLLNGNIIEMVAR